MLRVTEESKTYIIYKHVSPSGKVYIGQTNQIPELRFRSLYLNMFRAKLKLFIENI